MANQQLPIRHSSLPFFLVASFTLLLLPLLPHPASNSSLSPPRASSGFSSAVAADEGRCSLVGTATLRRGGNAVDAAVASALCLGVVNPMSSGLGGGAFLLLRMANSGLARAYDMREVAPAAASENMYNVNSQLGITGGLAVAVPGELAGLHLVWQQHGRLPWASLVKPAIKLAAGGFVVRRYLAFYLNQSAQDILADKGLSEVFAPNGILLRAGDICHRKKLAETLEAIAKEGPGVFYDGIIGENFVADVKEAGGILTKEDLRNYKVEVKQPLVSDVFGFTVLGVPPPAGGACLILILNILAAYKSTAVAIKGPLGLHRIIEAFKHTYAIRMNLGDPSFVNVTDVLADMLSPSFASELQKRISDNTTFPPDYYGGR